MLQANPTLHQCSCHASNLTTFNDNHDDGCALWRSDGFWRGEQTWDSESQSLVSCPPHIPAFRSDALALENGDAPAKILPNDSLSLPECDHINRALFLGLDDSGYVKLPDGSWVDVESEITFRRIPPLTDGSDETWTEEPWYPTTTRPISLPPVTNTQKATCTCVPQQSYYCGLCGVQRSSLNSPWYAAYSPAGADSGDYWSDYSKGGSTKSTFCTHTLNPLKMPSGHTVFASSQKHHTTTTTPDYGLYASVTWDPDCVATFIPWQDYGLPYCPFPQAADAIVEAYKRSLTCKLEVGCIGAHGRTGTILACMTVIDDPTISGDDAVQYVRTHHCHKAVESKDQEWFVRWFAAYYRALDFDEPRPEKKVHTPAITVTPAATTYRPDPPGRKLTKAEKRQRRQALRRAAHILTPETYSLIS